MRGRRGVLGGVLLLLASGCSQSAPDPYRVGSEDFAQHADAAVRTNKAQVVSLPCATSTASSASNAPEDARGWTNTFAQLDPTVWRSGDVGASAALSDGRVVWLFGDTSRAAGVMPRVVANSMLLSRGSCFEEVRFPGNGPVIPSSDASTACWPSSVLAVPMKVRDVVLVACSRIKRGTGGKPGGEALYDFSYRGMSLALYAVPRGGAPALVHVSDVFPDSPDQQQINWGAAMVGDDGWVYIYGSRQPKGHAGKAAYVARTRLSDVGGHATWQYWSGSRFTRHVDDAKPLIDASEGVSQTFSVVSWRGRFLLVSKQGGEFGANVGIWQAPHPYGPWTGLKGVPQPYSLGGGVVAYQPLAHPEIPTPDGGLLVSMSRNTEDVKDLFTDPRKGRLMFLDVQIP